MELAVFFVYSIDNPWYLDRPQHTYLPDEELLKQFQRSNDMNLLGLLLQRYTLLLLGVAVKYLKDKDAAQDAVQQVFLKAITHLPKEEVQNFKGWLYILMRNHCFQLLRDKHYLTDDKVLNDLVAVPLDKEELEWKDHTLAQIDEALPMLDEEQRQCITLFYLQDKSYKQIMEQTGFEFAQVKSYIQNGKRNLKQILMKQKK